MNTDALIIMISAQVIITACMVYFFVRVMKTPQEKDDN